MYAGEKEEGEAEGKVRQGSHEEAIVGGQAKDDGLGSSASVRQKGMVSRNILEVDLMGLDGLHV